MLYDIMYGTSQDRVERLTLVGMSSTNIEGLDPGSEKVLGITDMFVIPTGKDDRRIPWVMISVAVAPLEVAADAADPSLYESRKRSICSPLDMRKFLAFFGALQTGPYVCSMNSFFETMRSSGYSPVVLRRAHPD
jgi:hypothetical protein